MSIPIISFHLANILRLSRTIFVWMFFCAFSFGFVNAKPQVVVLPYQGAIDPFAQLQLERAIKDANHRRAEAVVIELDTPGGMLSTTRTMVQMILNSTVPVIVFVSPRGAHAGSAGVFITMAAHVAAMAPGTNIGAAHPVSISSGKLDSIGGAMGDKVLNDASAQIRTIAMQRGRNVDWAISAVRKSVAITETEAESLKVIDFVANNLDDLLTRCDGKAVKLADGSTHVLHTREAVVVSRAPGFGDKLLSVISDPNVSYILLALGFYGLLFEFQNPGAIWPGVMGGLCLIFAFTSFQVLPVNLAGLILIIIAFILFVLEVKVVSKGAFTVGGIIAMTIGSLMLFDLPADVPGISWYVIAAVVFTTVVFFVFVVSAGVKALRRRVVTGSEGLVGEEAEVIQPIDPEGKVFVHGELWRAAANASIVKGTKVIIERIEGTLLYVHPK